MASKHPVKIFISHNERDVLIAKALIKYLESVFTMEDGDIRCTSVGGYKIPAGVNIAEQLKNDVKVGLGFFAILSYFGLESAWVKNELGAAWSKDRVIIPILGPKLKPSDKRLAAISSIPVLEIDDKDIIASINQYIKQLGEKLKQSPKFNDSSKNALNNFIKKYRTYGGGKANFSKTDVKIISPRPGGILHDKTKVGFEVKNRPRSGFLWIGILIDTKFYPKALLNTLIKNGKGSIEVEEGGSDKSDKKICIIGVGAAGNYQIEIELKREFAEKDWSGMEINDIQHAKELYTVGKLKREH